MWDIKLKATNEQTGKTNKDAQTQMTVWWLPGQKECRKIGKLERVKYMVTGDDLTLGCGHTMQCTDQVL